MRRSNQLNPMRMLVLLAVLWVAGTLLFAAESTPPAAKPRPAEATTVPAQAPAAEPAARSPPAGEQAADAKDASAKAEAPGEEESPAEETASVPESKTEGGDAKQASSADKGGTPRRFVPSEQVRADFDVSFPIDI
jgi:hypothetical protein